MEGHDVCGNIEFDSVAILRSNISGPDSRRLGQDYRKLEDRMKSFNFWPPGMPVESKDLAEAGLYYTGRGDKVVCFSCNGGLKDWVKNDDPWLEHAVWYPGCRFVISEKSEKFIIESRKAKFEQQMIEENNQDSGYDSPESQEIQPENSDSQKTNDENLCIICCDQERSLVFIPCGHLVSCGRCAVNFTTCPNCRSDITGSAKVRFS